RSPNPTRFATNRGLSQGPQVHRQTQSRPDGVPIKAAKKAPPRPVDRGSGRSTHGTASSVEISPAWKNMPRVPPVMTKTPAWKATARPIAIDDFRRKARASPSSQRMTVQDSRDGSAEKLLTASTRSPAAKFGSPTCPPGDQSLPKAARSLKNPFRTIPERQS